MVFECSADFQDCFSQCGYHTTASELFGACIKNKDSGSLAKPASVHEDEHSIPGLAQWIKDLVLL